MALSISEQIVVDLFIAAYGRAPTQGGLDFFAGQLDNGEMTPRDIASFMVDPTHNPEAAIRFPENGTTEDKVNAVFEHVLGRPVATVTGLTFWSNRVDNEDGYTMADLIYDVLEAAKNQTDDAQTLLNKRKVVEFFLENVPVDEQVGKQVSTDDIITESDAQEAISKILGADTNIDMQNVKSGIIHLTPENIDKNATFVSDIDDFSDYKLQVSGLLGNDQTNNIFDDYRIYLDTSKVTVIADLISIDGKVIASFEQSSTTPSGNNSVIDTESPFTITFNENATIDDIQTVLESIQVDTVNSGATYAGPQKLNNKKQIKFLYDKIKI